MGNYEHVAIAFYDFTRSVNLSPKSIRQREDTDLKVNRCVCGGTSSCRAQISFTKIESEESKEKREREGGRGEEEKKEPGKKQWPPIGGLLSEWTE